MIRLAMAADFAAVYRLLCALEETELPRAGAAAAYAELLTAAGHTVWVAEEAGAVIGFAHLRTEAQLHHAARVAELMELAVDAAWRGQGIGRALLDTAADFAAADGCIQIELACNRLRTAAHRFYAREGLHPFHFKFSKPLTGADTGENRLGR